MIFFPHALPGPGGHAAPHPGLPAAVRRLEHGRRSIGAFGFGLSQVLFLFIVLDDHARQGKTAPQKPWEGAEGLEWTHLPTPAPFHTFETPRSRCTK